MSNVMLRAAAAATIVTMSGAAAFAGGFSLKEGSTASQGASFAGATAGGDDITYSFFNPAALRTVENMEIGFSNSAIAPSGEVEAAGGTYDGGEVGFVGAFYIGARVNEKLVLGASLSAPFGLATEYDRGTEVSFDALRTDLKSFAFTAMASYDVNPQLTIGGGFTYLYGTLVFENSVGLALLGGSGVGNLELDGTGDGFGFSAGLIYDATPDVTIGFAFKSGYNFEGEGDLVIKASSGATVASDSTTQAAADLPPVISMGARVNMTESFTALAEVQWQGWASLDYFALSTDVSPLINGEEFGYEDAFYIALGGEYQAAEGLVLRSGVAFDQTPTTDAHRSPRVPDGDRMWLSAGGSYMFSEHLKFDAAYSYIFALDDNPLGLNSDGNPFNGDDQTATVKGNAHIFSLGASYEF